MRLNRYDKVTISARASLESHFSIKLIQRRSGSSIGSQTIARKLRIAGTGLSASTRFPGYGSVAHSSRNLQAALGGRQGPRRFEEGCVFTSGSAQHRRTQNVVFSTPPPEGDYLV